MAKHSTYIMSEDAKAQADFYAQALGGEIQSIQTHGQLPNYEEKWKDKVLHLSLVAAGVTFFMCDNLAPVNPGTSIYQCLEYTSEAEAREAFDNLSQGGQVLHPLQREFWGALFGQLEDKFGVRWMITTEASNANPD